MFTDSKDTYSLSTARFRFTMQAGEEAVLPPYLGSTLRGSLGWSLRKMLCMKQDEKCLHCMARYQCSYVYLFESFCEQANKDSAGVKYLPHPFVIEPSLERKTDYVKDDQLQFNLLLIGTGIQFLPVFIMAFSAAAQNGLGGGRYKFYLSKVEQIVEGTKRLLWEGRDVLLTGPVIKNWCINANMHEDEQESGEETLLVQLLTPARIVDNGSLSVELAFSMLMRRIIRRLDDLSRAHGSGPLEIDFTGWLREAESVKQLIDESELYWQDWERYSNRQQTLLKMGGILGKSFYQGAIHSFQPFLDMAQEVHIGKGTVLGMGQIKYERGLL